MGNKLFLVCATLALCFLLTNASIYRTIVELDTDGDTHLMGPGEKCRKEFQQDQHLRACQQFIRQQASQGQGGGLALDGGFDFEDDFSNSHGSQQGQGQQQILQQCCNELHQEEPVCVCPTLQAAARAVRQHQGQHLQGQHQGQSQARQIFKIARRLPNVCNIPQVGKCPFKADLPPVSSY